MTDVQGFRTLAFQTRLAVWWGFLWRGLVATIGSALGGSVAGGVMGLTAGMTGLAPASTPFLALTGGERSVSGGHRRESRKAIDRGNAGTT